MEPYDLPTAVTIAQIVRSTRHQLNWTRPMLARRAKLSARTVRNIEEARHPTPRRDSLEKIAFAFGLSDRKLFLQQDDLLLETLPRASESPARTAIEAIQRTMYYLQQYMVEQEAQEIFYGTPALPVSFAPADIQMRLIHARYGRSEESLALSHAYCARAAAALRGVSSGRIRRFRAVCLEGQTRRALAELSEDERQRRLAVLEPLLEEGLLELTLVTSTLPQADLQLFSFGLVIGKERRWACISDQPSESAWTRPLRIVRHGGPLFGTTLDLFETYAGSRHSITVAPHELWDVLGVRRQSSSRRLH